MIKHRAYGACDAFYTGVEGYTCQRWSAVIHKGLELQFTRFRFCNVE